jgi:gas vesicle protein
LNEDEEAAMADNEGNAIDRLTYLIIGAGIGAAVALLFAPKAGRELRGDIADVTKKGIDYSKEGARFVGDKATDIYGQTTQKAQDLIEAGKGTIAAKREQFVAAIEAGKDAYAEEKQRVGAGRAIGSGEGGAQGNS